MCIFCFVVFWTDSRLGCRVAVVGTEADGPDDARDDKTDDLIMLSGSGFRVQGWHGVDG